MVFYLIQSPVYVKKLYEYNVILKKIFFEPALIPKLPEVVIDIVRGHDSKRTRKRDEVKRYFGPLASVKILSYIIFLSFYIAVFCLSNNYVYTVLINVQI